ncbi:MAG: transporter substrate-binding domain-containing protein [Woeseiaceae bacterium]|nr:transporter substrate-binding domain-containing protein [Woeseiaceae bacterium]
MRSSTATSTSSAGATTVTLSRREQVDFTLMTYTTGGTVLSTRENPIHTLENLPGKRIGGYQGHDDAGGTAGIRRAE